MLVIESRTSSCHYRQPVTQIVSCGSTPLPLTDPRENHRFGDNVTLQFYYLRRAAMFWTTTAIHTNITSRILWKRDKKWIQRRLPIIAAWHKAQHSANTLEGWFILLKSALEPSSNSRRLHRQSTLTEIYNYKALHSPGRSFLVSRWQGALVITGECVWQCRTDTPSFLRGCTCWLGTVCLLMLLPRPRSHSSKRLIWVLLCTPRVLLCFILWVAGTVKTCTGFVGYYNMDRCWLHKYSIIGLALL